MPENLPVAAFIFGAVLILLSLVGGGFKIFGAEFSGKIGAPARIAAFLLGGLFIIVGVADLLPGFRPFSPGPGQPTPGPPRAAADVAPCFAKFFGNIPSTRLKTLEAGSKDVTLIGADESKTAPLGISLTQSGEPVGAIRLSFFPDNDLFKIAAVVNAACETIVSYRNETRGGDKNLLQNWDSLSLAFGNDNYSLRLGYSDGEITANHFRQISLR